MTKTKPNQPRQEEHTPIKASLEGTGQGKGNAPGSFKIAKRYSVVRSAMTNSPNTPKAGAGMAQPGNELCSDKVLQTRISKKGVRDLKPGCQERFQNISKGTYYRILWPPNSQQRTQLSTLSPPPAGQSASQCEAASHSIGQHPWKLHFMCNVDTLHKLC